MSGALISVIVIFDRGRFEPCLTSLLAQEGMNFEIIAVVPDETAALGVPRHGRVQTLSISDRNPARRRNLAAARARGQYLAFIDDDAFAPPDWLRKGVGRLEGGPGLAGVGGPNLIPEGAGFSERVTDMVLTTRLIGAGSRAYSKRGTAAPAKPGEVHLVNFLVRREWFERVRGFNEEIGYGGEDTEFVLLAAKQGGRFVFDPELWVFHRRRRFGWSYFGQRFKLRAQSARLFIAYPSVYITNAGFLFALIGFPLLAALAIALFVLKSAAGIAALAGLYVAACLALSWRRWRRRPLLALIAPWAFFAHHAVNLAGLWWGLAGALVSGPWRVRRKLRSSRSSLRDSEID
ncbi:MAG TPA: glycosyltransferase family 2 protein [bacterium]|nr:glycosyltransferase family 2 protein [bacterium]